MSLMCRQTVIYPNWDIHGFCKGVHVGFLSDLGTAIRVSELTFRNKSFWDQLN